MITSPPENAGAVHWRVIESPVLSAMTSETPVGGSGYVTMTAPLPSVEAVESPYTLIAETRAKTLEPQSRVKGDALIASTGTTHVVSTETDISQLEVSTEYVEASF